MCSSGWPRLAGIAIAPTCEPLPARSTGGRIRTNPELVDELFAGGSGGVSRRGYLYQLVGGIGWTSLPLLPLLRQPTLVVAGDDDPIIPLANAHLMTRLLPRPACTSTTTATSD
ncbi:MAG: hypothetical protein ACXV1K_00275 [Kineosporiaceae bacterium]